MMSKLTQKLGDIELTNMQVEAFRRWLDLMEFDHENERRQAEIDKRHEDFKRRCDEKLIELAVYTARRIGLVQGVTLDALASATWDDFLNFNGFYCRLDVDEYFDPESDYDSEMRWVNSFCNTQREMIAADREVTG